MKATLVLAVDDENQCKTGVNLTKALDSPDNADNAIIGIKKANPMIRVELNNNTVQIVLHLCSKKTYSSYIVVNVHHRQRWARYHHQIRLS
jgi:hypothetical protein